MKDIRFGVIGSGFMGGVLGRAAHELPYAQCVGIADVDFERAERLTVTCGGHAYRDFNEMLDKEKPEAVFIATPEPYHRLPVLAAAQHGCHIFLEKPMATSLEDADVIKSACEAARVKLMVGYILRFEVTYAMIKAALDEGRAGRLLSIYARRMATIGEARRLQGRVSPVSYIGVHDIDQMLWYHPAAVKSVYARATRGRVWEELGTYDSAWMMIEFCDGVIGIHEVGWCLPQEWADWKTPQSWGSFGDVRMNVVGTDGAINMDLTPMNLYACDPEGWKFPDTRHWPSINGKLSGAVKLEVEHFFECVLTDRLPLIGAVDGRRSLEVMLAAEKSISEGKKIDLPL